MSDIGRLSGSAQPAIERHPNLRRRGLLILAALVVAWKIYVVLASSFAVRQLQSLADRSDVRIEHVDARSWFPGYLVIRDLVVSHTLHGHPCRTSATEIDVPHDASRLLVGKLHIEVLTAHGVQVACGVQPQPPAPATPARGHMGMLGLAKLATAAHDTPTDAAALTAERATIRIDSLSLGRARLSTPFEVKARGVRVDASGQLKVDRAAADLESGTIAWERQPMLEDIRASLQVANAQAEPERGEAPGLRTTLIVHGARLQGLPWLVEQPLSTVRGTLRTKLIWYGSDLAPHSSLNLSVDPLELKHGDSGQIRLASTSTVEVLVRPANGSERQRVAWQLASPWVQYQRDQKLAASASTIRLGLEAEPGAVLPSSNAEFSFTGRALSLRRDALTLEAEEASFEGQLAGDPSQTRLFDTARLSLVGARLHGDQVSPELDSTNTTETNDRRFSLRVDASAVSARAGYSGTIKLEGGDAGVILTLTQARDLPSWIVSKFEAQPFALDARLSAADDTVRVRDMMLERGALRLTGWWQLLPTRDTGALLMQYGGLSVGIGAGVSGQQVVVNPSSGWLQSRTPPPLVQADVQSRISEP